MSAMDYCVRVRRRVDRAVPSCDTACTTTHSTALGGGGGRTATAHAHRCAHSPHIRSGPVPFPTSTSTSIGSDMKILRAWMQIFTTVSSCSCERVPTAFLCKRCSRPMMSSTSKFCRGEEWGGERTAEEGVGKVRVEEGTLATEHFGECDVQSGAASLTLLRARASLAAAFGRARGRPNAPVGRLQPPSRSAALARSSSHSRP